VNNRTAGGPSQVITLGQFEHAVSKQRLQAYVQQHDDSPLDAVGRYFWNAALVSAIMPEIHLFEVAFRNHLYGASKRVLSAAVGPSGTWLDATPDLLEPSSRKEVDEAKRRLNTEGRLVNEGRLIAKLGLGFWVRLCSRPYEVDGKQIAGLWPPVLQQGGFRGLTQNRTRATIHAEAEAVRDHRNRISHHEPIWDRDVMGLHRRIEEVLGWISRGLPALLSATSHVDRVYNEGIGPFRAMAEQLVRLQSTTRSE
jgi:hypothetical protein